ncbi:hypothetical protein ACQPU1_04110 [Clostridium paraputrificum]|uniref:hypothetical protein n=1 Tax=Clostridium TaxID=1485 RepID=UPI003D329993
MSKKNFIIILLLAIITPTLFMVIDYKREKNLILSGYELNDEFLEHNFNKISQQLLKYSTDGDNDNISKASLLSYTINESTYYFRKSSHYTHHECSLNTIFSLFERNITNYKINELLDSSILPQLASLFDTLSSDVDDPIINGNIIDLLKEIWGEKIN